MSVCAVMTIVGISGCFAETLFKKSIPFIPGILISVIIKSGTEVLSASKASEALGNISMSKSCSSALLQIVLILSSSSIIHSLDVIFCTPRQYY